MRLIPLLALLLLVAGCTSTDQVVLEEEPIPIGWFGPLSGSAASFGWNNLRGIELAIDDINERGGIFGRPLKLVAEDDKEEVSFALTAFEKLTTQDRVAAILTTNYPASLALAEKAAARKIPIIDSVDTSEELVQAGDYVFSVGIYDDAIGRTMADFLANKLNKKRVGIVYLNDNHFYLLVKSELSKRFESLGGAVVATEGYPEESTDFRGPLSKLKGLGVDALVLLGFDESGLALKQARELGIDADFLLVDTATGNGFLENASGAEEGIYFTYWAAGDKERAESLRRRYVAKYGIEPDQMIFVATGYDATFVLAEALKTGGTDGEKLKKALYNVKGLSGVSGELTVDADGGVRSIREQVFQYVNGEPVFLGNP